MSMSTIIQRTLFNDMIGTGDNNHSKRETFKNCNSLCQPLNSLMNITFAAFTSASNFNNFL